jgi:hypothetical protein
MKIRTLDCDLNHNELGVFWGGNGDVYVTIYREDDAPVSVRVGMGGSGMHLPGEIGTLLANLATEFEKYNEFENECDAYMYESQKRWDELRKINASDFEAM